MKNRTLYRALVIIATIAASCIAAVVTTILVSKGL